MEKYDYRRAIIDDLKDWIVNESDILEEDILEERDDELYAWIYDETWGLDEITGNGTYFYSDEETCSEYLSGNFDLVYKAAHEYCLDNDASILIKNYEEKSLARYFDATIRCYLLGDCIEKAMEELRNETN